MGKICPTAAARWSVMAALLTPQGELRSDNAVEKGSSLRVRLRRCEGTLLRSRPGLLQSRGSLRRAGAGAQGEPPHPAISPLSRLSRLFPLTSRRRPVPPPPRRP